MAVSCRKVIFVKNLISRVFISSMINYITSERKRLKTDKNKENKKAMRVNTPPKTFSFQSLSDFPRRLLNGCKDSTIISICKAIANKFGSQSAPSLQAAHSSRLTNSSQ
jgi:hypothetical protein